MQTALELIGSVGAWSLSSLWLPLLAWTLVALPAYALLDRWHRHPLVQYRARQALLAALPLGLLAAWLAPPLWPAAPPTVVMEVVVTPLSASAAEPASSPGLALGFNHVLGLVTFAAGLLALCKLARLMRQALALGRLRRTLSLKAPAAVQRLAQRLATRAGIRRPVRTVLTERPLVPMTFGGLRPLIVLPSALAENESRLRMTLAHELVHIRRLDYLAQWFEHLTAALFAVHPLVGSLCRSIADYRERACDAAVLTEAPVNTKHYASLLFDFARVDPERGALTVSIAETVHNLKERIEAMKDYRFSPQRLLQPKTASLILAAVLFGAAALVVACSDLAAPDEPTAEAPQAQQESPSDDKVFVVVEEMPMPKGGMATLQEKLRYPELARKAGIEGHVFVQFVVDEQGNVQDATVQKGVHEALDAAALEAVQETEFEPGMQRGHPVKVRMTLPVTFRLPGEETTNASSANQPNTETEAGPLRAENRQMSFRELQFDGGSVTGRVVDAATGQPLAGTNVIVPNTNKGTVTRSDGSFTLRADASNIAASFVGYESIEAQQ